MSALFRVSVHPSSQEDKYNPAGPCRGIPVDLETLKIVLPAVRTNAHGDKVFSLDSAANQRIASVLAEICNKSAGGMGF